MTGADLLHRRESLGLSREQFADVVYEHPDQIAEWEGIRGRLPSGLSRRLELVLANEERLVAIRAAGIEDCPWVVAHLAGATAGDPKDLQRRLAEVASHRETCPLCKGPERTRTQSSAAGVIVSSGRARIALSPDRATISIAIDTRAPTAPQASLANGRKQQAVLDTLRRLGYSPDEAWSVGFSVTSQYDARQPGAVLDYQAHLDIGITVNDLERLGATIDGALAAGSTEVRHIEFTSDSMAAGRSQALIEAVESARQDAEALAAGAGGSLGRLLELSTVPTASDPTALATTSVPLAGFLSPVRRSEVIVEITVHARWEFRPQ